MAKRENTDFFRYKTIFRAMRMPLAFVDLEKFDANIAYVASTQNNTGKTIRIGTKSLRCTELIKRVFQKGGSPYKGILSFTLEEAAFLVSKGFDDIIVAYPSLQPSSIKQFIKLTKSKKRIRLVIDSVEHLRILSNEGQKAGVRLSVCLDLDMSYRPLGSVHLGVRRSPIHTVEHAVKLAQASKAFKWVTIDAVMGYEAHIASLCDDVPGKILANKLMFAFKRLSSKELTIRRDTIVEALNGESINIKTVNGGGSGSLKYSGKDPILTEVTAGSAFYCSGLFQHFKDVHFLPAAFFAVEVVRKPAPGMITCLGGGYTASGEIGPNKLPTPVFPAGLKLLTREAAGEVQTPLMLPPDCPSIELGDPIFFQHAKAGELCERFNELYLLEGSKIVGKVKTYRGEGKAFL